MSEDKQMKNEYEAFLMNYGKDVSPQEAKQALYDSQIKNMSLGITTIVNSSDKGTILDIGCGKGIILERLNKTETFLKNTGWKYLGIDVEEYEKTLLILAAKLRLHTRVDFVQLKDFQEMDISEESCPLPFFTIQRHQRALSSGRPSSNCQLINFMRGTWKGPFQRFPFRVELTLPSR